MACNCLEEIPKAVKSSCNENQDFFAPVTNIEWVGLAQSALDKQGELRLSAKMKIYTENCLHPKYRDNFFIYCPFCGAKY